MRIELVPKTSSVNIVAQKMSSTAVLTTINADPATTPIISTAALGAGTDSTRATAFLMIMSGPMPNVSSLQTLGDGWDGTTRKALVNWGNTGTADGVVIATANLNTITFEAPFKAASASGTASWFWIGMKKAAANIAESEVIHSIIGSIGGFGSGEDLECYSTSIVEGNNYRVANLKITFPLVFEY